MDSQEFVELLNAGPSDISLANLVLILVNGSNSTEYARFDLSDAGVSLAAGQYLVLGSASAIANTAGGALTSEFPGSFAGIQNGGPDGLLIFDTSTSTVIDALSYEGEVTAANLTGVVGTVNLVEGTAASAADLGAGSLARSPNGGDSGDADVDWISLGASTPGASNDP